MLALSAASRPFLLAKPRWGLKARLLGPLITLALIGVTGIAVVEDLADRRHTEALIAQRGATVLDRVLGHLQQRQRAEELFAQLIAEQPGWAEVLESANPEALASALEPLATEAPRRSVTLHDREGRQRAQAGPAADGWDPPVVTTALSGPTISVVTVSTSGIEILAGAPIRAPGIVGAVTVRTLIDEAALSDLKGREATELVVLGQGRVVTSTVTDPEVARQLASLPSAAEGLAAFNRALHPYGRYAAAATLAGDGVLLSLVHTDDLVAAAWQRAAAGVGGTTVLMLVLVVAYVLLAEDIARPLQSVIRATGELVRGRYGRRVDPSSIRELDELAGAINHLGERLEEHVTALQHRAFHDALTGLPNRALFMDRLTGALALHQRSGRPVGVIFVDLDNFKVVNDNLGHDAGDALLEAVAHLLQANLRDQDTAARLGGDEFVVLLPELESADAAHRVAERIVSRLEAPFALAGREVFVTASVGMAVCDAQVMEPDALLRAADSAMYRAKANGKARYEIFDPIIDRADEERLDLESGIRHAIERGELRLHYQPIVALASERLVGVEALIRWEHPQRGLLLPGSFIRVAEETGLITPLTRWVLRTACHQAREWQLRYEDAAPSVSVNVSAKAFERPEFLADLTRILTETGVDPGLLRIEITETTMMRDVEVTHTILQQIKDRHVRLSVDDFGTGYSSLAYLKRFPIDLLKIDRSFVDGLGRDPEDSAIVRTIILLAQGLNLATVAEGIETADQLAALRALGCDQGQGYWFAPAGPAPFIDELLANPQAWQPTRGGQLTPVDLGDTSTETHNPEGRPKSTAGHSTSGLPRGATDEVDAWPLPILGFVPSQSRN